MDYLATLDAKLAAAIISAVISGVVAFIIALSNRSAQRRLEETKTALQSELEHTKALLAERLSEGNARLSYEFDAKKRLYADVEPLFFQLYHACESSYYRVASLVRSQRQGQIGDKDSWLNRDGYYMRSTIYHLFLPMAVYRLIQRSTTFVDIRLEENLRTKYFLLKQDYFVFTDHFDLAQLDPALAYTPHDDLPSNWTEDTPENFVRQGLFIGEIDRLIESFIVLDHDSYRTITFGEFESRASKCENFKNTLTAPYYLLTGFGFQRRSVFGRALLAHAYIMRLMLYCFSRDATIQDLIDATQRFSVSNEALDDLAWEEKAYREIAPSIQGYVEKRISWISPDDYDI